MLSEYSARRRYNLSKILIPRPTLWWRQPHNAEYDPVSPSNECRDVQAHSRFRLRFATSLFSSAQTHCLSCPQRLSFSHILYQNIAIPFTHAPTSSSHYILLAHFIHRYFLPGSRSRILNPLPFAPSPPPSSIMPSDQTYPAEPLSSKSHLPSAPRPETQKSAKQHWLLHQQRSKQILADHPEVRSLYGTDNRTQYYAYLCIITQLFLCWLSRHSYARAIFFGLTIGPYVNAAILCLIHEATHMLVFKKPAYNRLLSIATNIPLVIPISEILRQHHSRHHRSLGNNHHDVDVPSDIEIAIVGNNTLRKAIWLTFNMIILPVRSVSRLPVLVDKYLVLNWVACLSFDALALLYSRSTSLFLILAFLNSQGFHPANTRQVQRHVYNGDEKMRTAEDRPTTYSYYGVTNLIFLNVGYHVEHHDFSHIPWTRLPTLRRIAGDKWYPDECAYHGRGMPELINFVTNPNISLADFAR